MQGWLRKPRLGSETRKRDRGSFRALLEAPSVSPEISFPTRLQTGFCSPGPWSGRGQHPSVQHQIPGRNSDVQLGQGRRVSEQRVQLPRAGGTLQTMGWGAAVAVFHWGVEETRDGSFWQLMEDK